MGLDGLPDQGQQILVEHAFSELAVDVLVLVQRQQQAFIRCPQGPVAGLQVIVKGNRILRARVPAGTQIAQGLGDGSGDLDQQ